MYKHSFSRFALLGLLAVTVIGAGCAHHVPPAAPTPTATAPAPTPPARPTVTLQASSTFIQRGESATLTWSSTNATSLTLNPTVGSIAPRRLSRKFLPQIRRPTRSPQPAPVGTADQSIRITVSAAAPPVTTDNTPTETPDAAFMRNMHDAYFDYNEATLRADAKDALSAVRRLLRHAC